MDSWNDGELTLETKTRLEFTSASSKYGKQIWTATIPYNSEDNRYLYRTVIAKMRWLRYVFDNEAYNHDGFIVRRSNSIANQLFFSTTDADQTQAAREILEEIIQYRYYKPIDGAIHTSKYSSYVTKSLKFNVDYDNFNGRDETAGSDFAFEVGRSTNTHVHPYPLPKSSSTVVVVQGRKSDREKAMKMLKAFAKNITDKLSYHEARTMALSMFDNGDNAEDDNKNSEEEKKDTNTDVKPLNYIPAVLKKPLPPPPPTPPTPPQPIPKPASPPLISPTFPLGNDLWMPPPMPSAGVSYQCVRCNTHVRRVLNMPCAHLGLCVVCADQSVARRELTCCLCNQLVQSRILVYTS